MSTLRTTMAGDLQNQSSMDRSKYQNANDPDPAKPQKHRRATKEHTGAFSVCGLSAKYFLISSLNDTAVHSTRYCATFSSDHDNRALYSFLQFATKENSELDSRLRVVPSTVRDGTFVGIR